MTKHKSTETQPIRAALYLRISADPEGKRAGVEGQRRDCQRLAEDNGWEVVAVLEDNDVSAYSGETRPAFEDLVEGAQAGDFDVVVTWASDRLYRRVADLVRITSDLAPHVAIRTVMGGEVDLTTAEGIRNAQQAGVYAEYESRRKGERVAARAAKRAQDGRAVASVRPFGWAWIDPCPGGTECAHRDADDRPSCEPGQTRRPRLGSRRGLTPHPVEAPMLTEAYARIKAGDSLRATTRDLVAQGALGAVTGQPLTSSALRSALLIPRNAGLVAHRDEVVAEAADGIALVDRGTWEAVRAILTDPARRKSPESRTSTPLGGSLLTCGRCGGPMSASNRHDPQTGAVVPIYVCSRNQHLSRRRALLDGPILDLARTALGHLEGSGLLAVAVRPDPETDPLRERVAAAEDRLATLAAMVADGTLDPIDYAPAAKRIRADLDDLKARLTRKAGRPATARVLGDPDGVVAAFDRLVAQAEEGTPDGLRSVLRELFASVVVQVPEVSGWPTAGDVTVTWADWLPAGAPTAPVVEAGAIHVSMEARRAQVAALRAEGLGVSAIAERLGVYRATIRRDLQALGGAAA